METCRGKILTIFEEGVKSMGETGWILCLENLSGDRTSWVKDGVFSVFTQGIIRREGSWGHLYTIVHNDNFMWLLFAS